MHNSEEEELERFLKHAIMASPFVRDLEGRLEREIFPDPGLIRPPDDVLSSATRRPKVLGTEPGRYGTHT